MVKNSSFRCNGRKSYFGRKATFWAKSGLSVTERMLRSYRNITKSSPKELILAERLPFGRYESFGRHNGFGRNWNSPFGGLSVSAEREKTLSVVP